MTRVLTKCLIITIAATLSGWAVQGCATDRSERISTEVTDALPRIETTAPVASTSPAPRIARRMPATTRRVATTQPRTPRTSGEYVAIAADLRAQYAKSSSEWPAAVVDAGVEFTEIGLLPPVEYPAFNPHTPEKEALGKLLFFEPKLSGSGQIACASCHDPDLAWADGRLVSFGHDRSALRRNSPSVQFSGYAKSQFWDGRSGSLEDQFQTPVMAPDEMNSGKTLGEATARLQAVPAYRKLFKDVFGEDAITITNAAKAVATYERAISGTAGRSAFDQFIKGRSAALSDSAVRGLHLFRTDARCMNCHSGPTFTDNQFHDVGLSYYGRKYEDLGRYEATQDAADVGRFRTPSLRNVGRTRPYMHNGLFELEGVINLYNAGMPTLRKNADQENDPLFPTKDKLLKPLGLNPQDRADLKAFLESLSEPPVRVRPPELPRLGDELVPKANSDDDADVPG